MVWLTKLDDFPQAWLETVIACTHSIRVETVLRSTLHSWANAHYQWNMRLHNMQMMDKTTKAHV